MTRLLRLLLVGAPLTPIAAAIVLASVVSLTQGHWPSYGNPDPKDLPVAYQPAYQGVLAFNGIFFLLLPIGAIASVWIVLFASSREANNPTLWLVATLLAWFTLFSWLLLDPLGLLEWLAD